MTQLSIRSRAPVASSPLVHRVMKANVGATTRPEMLLRGALHKGGLRFRKNVRPLRAVRCEADIVFPRQRVCVFIDGCYWHGCPFHFKCPKTNSDWWREKISANIERDRRQTQLLRDGGWNVLRFWEHEIQVDVDVCLSVIRNAIN
jgi:DNA mismatch endonuclease (patch repair protein)